MNLPDRRLIDKSIFALAIPALGSLAADPLYSLVDTAFVGHLGADELGAVAVGTAAFTASFWLFTFLAYGVTPKVAHAIGGGDRRLASRIGVQALFLALGLGLATTVFGVVFAREIVALIGARGNVASLAETYLRIRVLSAAPVLIVTVGHGWLRGDQDTRTPMIIATTGAVANIALDYLLIYVAGLGVAGAAWATFIGQAGAAVVFLLVLRRRIEPGSWRFEPKEMKSLLFVGSALIVRSGALVGALALSTSLAARMGIVALGSWQIVIQVFSFLALSLDAVAIAAQALVGRHLGAGEGEYAIGLSKRLMFWGIVFGVLLGSIMILLRVPIAHLFSGDERIVSATVVLLLWLGAVQPIAAVAFTLDGILLGASDARVLAAVMVGASGLFAVSGLSALQFQLGIEGLAAALTLWLLVRVLGLGIRWRGGRWAIPA